MQRVRLAFKVDNVHAIEEVQLTRATDGAVKTMRVLPIAAEMVEDAARTAVELATKQGQLTPTAQLYICTIRDDRPPEQQANGTLEERVVYGICLASEPATVEVIEPHLIKPYDVRQGA